jgi:NAD(P)-dependent dehydrogenase (short-subunit alcohol dehydrogenase family)
MFDLKGRVAAITGASSGLGLQMAKGFAGQGADLVIMARRIDRLEQVAEELRALGVKCLPVQCDVTDTDSVNKAAEAAIKEYGKVDILVNCAGSSKNAGVLNMTDEEWDFTVETDLTSVFKVTRAFAKYMVEKNYGRIINIASMYGLVGNTAIDTVAYHASKGGVVNFTRAVAAELAKYNITCNAICPGYFATELCLPPKTALFSASTTSKGSISLAH